MPPLAKKRRTSTPNSSPAKLSAKAKGKRKASAPTAAPSPSPRRRPRLHRPADSDDSASDSEDDYRDDHDLNNASTTFVTASAGDAYLLYSTQPSQTTDTLLSTSIDPAFTLSSYATALSHFDSLEHAAFRGQRDLSQARVQRLEARFPKWRWEMQQGFNILLTGLGSKRTVLNGFAEQARKTGHIVVVNGFDTASAMADIVTALEDLVRLQGEGNEPEEMNATPKKRARGNQAKDSPTKRGKVGAPSHSAPSTTAYRSARPVPALESRVRKLCTVLSPRSMSTAKASPPIFLVIHSLDAPSLRLTKHLSLLALLAAQPRIHLIASIDHVRAPLLFPTALATARPLHASISSVRNRTTEPPDTTHLRAFTFLYYDASTLLPYTREVLSQGHLSKLLPPSIFPPLSSSLDPTASSLAQSTTHVLASVTERAKRLFNMLGRQQVAVGEMLTREVERGMRLDAREGDKAPVVAMSLATFKTLATDALIATHPDQVDGLLSEFKDHGVVRSSTVAPEIVEGVNDDDEELEGAGGGGSAEWVWIPLGREALEEVLEELGIDE
ncbi:SPOSA6832_00468 [Sporobolomyces salmonicolor]|uniref:Origin recognition complex subunit 2 n=1 Tax=Sporidiobolus salmonicolor TaxID=5005 RepID=A0A0D6EGR3_SPOSA|nr:SPOSA6832_00468 [Sporobolomyces salmonicolor]